MKAAAVLWFDKTNHKKREPFFSVVAAAVAAVAVVAVVGVVVALVGCINGFPGQRAFLVDALQQNQSEGKERDEIQRKRKTR